MVDTRPISSLTVSDMIPVELFGQDHWSTLAYIETCAVDRRGGFRIICDPRMRTDGHNRRIWAYRNNANRVGCHLAVLGRNIDGTRLADGTRVPCHDDWDCIQDMAKIGYLRGDAKRFPYRASGVTKPRDSEVRRDVTAFLREQIDDTGIDLAARVFLTPLGFQVAAALRQHRAKGGTYATFKVGGIDDGEPTPTVRKRRRRKSAKRDHPDGTDTRQRNNGSDDRGGRDPGNHAGR